RHPPETAMPTVLDWNPTADPGEFARPVREALEAGLLVVLPGDAGYVVVAKPASPHAARLADVPATADDPPAVLAGGPEDAARLGLAVPVAARRLMLRAWPAPLVVALPAAGAALPADWPGPVRERMAREGFVRFRC